MFGSPWYGIWWRVRWKGFYGNPNTGLVTISIIPYERTFKNICVRWVVWKWLVSDYMVDGLSLTSWLTDRNIREIGRIFLWKFLSSKVSRGKSNGDPLLCKGFIYIPFSRSIISIWWRHSREAKRLVIKQQWSGGCRTGRTITRVLSNGQRNHSHHGILGAASVDTAPVEVPYGC